MQVCLYNLSVHIITGVPTMVPDVTFNDTGNNILSWGKPFNNLDPIVNYTVSCSGDVTCPPNFTTTDNTTRSYTITNLTPMTNYTFSVVATNSIGSGEAGVVMITTQNFTTPNITTTTTTSSMSMTSSSTSNMDTIVTTNSNSLITTAATASSEGMTPSNSVITATRTTSTTPTPTTSTASSMNIYKCISISSLLCLSLAWVSGTGGLSKPYMMHIHN